MLNHGQHRLRLPDSVITLPFASDSKTMQFENCFAPLVSLLLRSFVIVEENVQWQHRNWGVSGGQSWFGQVEMLCIPSHIWRMVRLIYNGRDVFEMERYLSILSIFRIVERAVEEWRMDWKVWFVGRFWQVCSQGDSHNLVDCWRVCLSATWMFQTSWNHWTVAELW